MLVVSDGAMLLKFSMHGMPCTQTIRIVCVFQLQWLFLVPLKGGRWHIIPQLAVYTTYIPLVYCLLGLYATYHLLGEPETTIDNSHFQKVPYYQIGEP